MGPGAKLSGKKYFLTFSHMEGKNPHKKETFFPELHDFALDRSKIS